MEETFISLDKDILQVSYEEAHDVSLINRDFSIYYKENPDIILVENSSLEEENNNNYIMGKSESLNQLFKDIDLYIEIYNLPVINISKKEWQIFCDNIYKLCQETKSEADYYFYLSTINRKTLAKALFDNQEKILINDYINSINCLKNHLKDDYNLELIIKKTRDYVGKSKIITLKRSF